MRNHLRILLTAALAAVGACGHKDADTKTETMVIAPPRDSAQRVLGSADIRIESSDGGVDLALIGDTISGGLSQKTLGKVKNDLDTSSVKATGFGGDIERLVKSSVQKGLGTRMGFSINDIKGARYENGRIVFDWVGKDPKIFNNTKVGDKPALESFSPADAQRFVDAVNARKDIQR